VKEISVMKALYGACLPLVSILKEWIKTRRELC